MDNRLAWLFHTIMLAIIIITCYTVLYNVVQIRNELKVPREVNMTVCHEYLAVGSRVIHCPNIEDAIDG